MGAEERIEVHAELVSSEIMECEKGVKLSEDDTYLLKVRKLSQTREKRFNSLMLKKTSSPHRGDQITSRTGSKRAPALKYSRVTLRCKGVNDETYVANLRIREAIVMMSRLLHSWPMLQIRAAESEAEMNEALKLYRDMNHLSLAGGITCEQVLHHVQSHTVLLYYRASEEEAPIAVTAATFSLRERTMMLRLLATHPRMTRKGFARITVHFLKELCRALHKTDILVYTYPSSAPFYKAMNFRHTHKEAARPYAAAAEASGAKGPAAANGAPPRPQLSKEEAREARRVFSAQENEMIYHVQPMIQQVVSVGFKQGSTAHPYACTRRRCGAAPDGQPQQADGQQQHGQQQHGQQPLQAQHNGPHNGPPSEGESVSSARLPSRLPSSSGANASDCDASPDAKRPGRRRRGHGRADGAGDGLGMGRGGGSASASANAAADADAAAAASSCVAAPSLSTTPSLDIGCVFSPLFTSPSPPSPPPPLHEEEMAQRDEGASREGDARRQGATRPSLEGDSDSDSRSGADAHGGDALGERSRKRSLEGVTPRVESLLGVRSCDGQLQYLVKWHGRSSESMTWEPASNLLNLQPEINAFESALKSARGSEH